MSISLTPALPNYDTFLTTGRYIPTLHGLADYLVSHCKVDGYINLSRAHGTGVTDTITFLYEQGQCWATGHFIGNGERDGERRTRTLFKRRERTAVDYISSLLKEIANEGNLFVAVNYLSRTLSDLSSAEYHTSEDAVRVDVMCCCNNRDCEASRAWADAERKLIVSAEVGQALLERHEAFERRHEALVKQNDSQTEHIATLNSQVSTLQEQLATHTRVQKQLTQAQLNLEAADAANRTLTKEVQDSRANISRLSAAHARGVGFEAKLRTAEQEREDLRREVTEANNKAKTWEAKANEASARCRKLQAEMVQLRDETDSIKLSRSEISSDILEDARARLQMLHNMLGQTSVASDDPEVMRVLEALVADNEALKRDAAELQNMLTESREDVRMLQEEIAEMRARGEGGQEPLAEDATDMSFTRSTPPPYNSLSQGLGGHGRNASWASVNARSGWAASFANSAKSPRGTGAQLDLRSDARNPPTGSAHSSRAASFSGNAWLTSPSASRFPRRVSSPRAIPPLIIPPMKRHGPKGTVSRDGTVQADEETGSENPLSAGSSALYSPRGLAPPVNQYRRASAANSVASERNIPLTSPGEAGERTPAGTTSFQWADLDGDEGDFFEFVAIGSNAPTAAFFETSILKAMYERKHLRSSDSATEAELTALTYQPPPPAKVSPATPKAGKAVTAAAPSPAPATSSAPPTPAKSEAKVKEPPLEAESQSSQVSERPAVVDEEAQLYLWESEPIEQFAFQAGVRAYIVENEEFEYYLTAIENGTYWLAHPISEDLGGRWSKNLLSFTWSHLSQGVASSWCFRFPDVGAFQRFQREYVRCLWEVTNKASWAKIKADEQQYAIDAHNFDPDTEMHDASDEEEDVEDELSTVEEENSEDEEDSDEEHGPVRMPDAGGKNKLLANGYKNGLSYIARGKNIGVFRKTEDDSLAYAATISKLLTPQGKQFAPKKMMLHQQDATLVLMNEQNPNALYQMDIETGKVVEEWKIGDHIEINAMTPDSKFAQMTPQQTLVGTSHNAVFRIDPRVSGNKLVDSEYKQYATKAAFSSVTTTDKGQLAVASEKGDIRLFDSIGKNAKTALPALGDPVIGVDVTADGRHVVATCRTYLLLIDTLIGEGRYAGSLGFDRSFPANAKPMPKRLQLRPEHLGYMGGHVSFTPARFNSGPESEEQFIVTSTGNFVIAWVTRTLSLHYRTMCTLPRNKPLSNPHDNHWLPQ
ncbi:hypothetical protein RSAG8_00736, partial [Rhizoctonia solani AG-8 WAC10335]